MRPLILIAAFDQTADAIDVPGDQVAAEAVAQLQRTLEVDARSFFQPAEIGAAQRLAADVKVQQISLFFDDGETAAADGDAVADLGIVSDERRFDGQLEGLDATAASELASSFDGGQFFDKARKHARHNSLRE